MQFMYLNNFDPGWGYKAVFEKSQGHPTTSSASTQAPTPQPITILLMVGSEHECVQCAYFSVGKLSRQVHPEIFTAYTTCPAHPFVALQNVASIILSYRATLGHVWLGLCVYFGS